MVEFERLGEFMAGQLGKLIIRHQLAKEELVRALDFEAEPSLESIASLDQSLEKLFQEILSMNLIDSHEKLERMRFAIGEINEFSERSELVRKLTDCMYKDACELVGDENAIDSKLKSGNS